MGQAMIEDRLLDVLSDPAGVRVAGFRRSCRAGAVGAVGLESHGGSRSPAGGCSRIDAAGLADVAELAGKLEQGELAPCYLLLRGHVVLRSRLDVLCNTILTPAGSGVATPGIATPRSLRPSLRDARCGATVRSIPSQFNRVRRLHASSPARGDLLDASGLGVSGRVAVDVVLLGPAGRGDRSG